MSVMTLFLTLPALACGFATIRSFLRKSIRILLKIVSLLNSAILMIQKKIFRLFSASLKLFLGILISNPKLLLIKLRPKILSERSNFMADSDNKRFIISKIINAILVALGAIAGAIFGNM